MKTESFIDYLKSKGYSSDSIGLFVRYAHLFLSWLAKDHLCSEQATYGDVLGYIQSRKNKVQPKTLSMELNSIRHYFQYLVAAGLRTDNPAADMELKGIGRRTLYEVLSKKELDALYHHFQFPDPDSPDKNQLWFKSSLLSAKRNKVIAGLMVYQGLNSFDLERLKEKDVQLREGTVRIAGSRRSEERLLELEAVQVLDLMEYQLKTRPQILTQTGLQSDCLLVATGGGNYFNNVVQSVLKTLRQQNSKVTSVNQIHTSVIVNWLKTYNLRQVQYMAGHRYVSSTEAYLIHQVEDLQKDIDQFHPLG